MIIMINIWFNVLIGIAEWAAATSTVIVHIIMLVILNIINTIAFFTIHRK